MIRRVKLEVKIDIHNENIWMSNERSSADSCVSQRIPIL